RVRQAGEDAYAVAVVLTYPDEVVVDYRVPLRDFSIVDGIPLALHDGQSSARDVAEYIPDNHIVMRRGPRYQPGGPRLIDNIRLETQIVGVAHRNRRGHCAQAIVVKNFNGLHHDETLLGRLCPVGMRKGNAVELEVVDRSIQSTLYLNQSGFQNRSHN